MVLDDSTVKLVDCTLTTGDGGRGGAGGSGGLGQPGGLGAAPGPSSCDLKTVAVKGGKGGAGGSGGSGAGGVGGVSIAIAYVGTAPDLDALTLARITVGNAGAGGEGGAPGNSGMPGVADKTRNMSAL